MLMYNMCFVYSTFVTIADKNVIVHSTGIVLIGNRAFEDIKLLTFVELYMISLYDIDVLLKKSFFCCISLICVCVFSYICKSVEMLH